MWNTKITNKSSSNVTANNEKVNPNSSIVLGYISSGIAINVEGAGRIQVIEPSINYHEYVSTSWAVEVVTGEYFSILGYEGCPTIEVIINPDLTFTVGEEIKDIVIREGPFDILKGSVLAYYPLRENAMDYSFNCKHGTMSPNLTFTDGIWHKSADFTKSKSYVILPDFDRYANYYTLSVWVKLKSYENIDVQSSDYGNILGRLNSSHSDGRLLFWFYYDNADSANNQAFSISSNKCLSVGNWHHVLVTYNHHMKKFSFYIDGSLDSTHDFKDRLLDSDRPHLPTFKTIGGWDKDSYKYCSTLNGLISDAAIFNTDVDQYGVHILSDNSHPLQKSDANFFPIILIPVFMAIVSLVASAYMISKLEEEKKQPDEPNYVTNHRLPPFTQPLNYIEHLDIWGEGYTEEPGIITGFTNCYNLNHKDQLVSNGADKSKKIPNQIPVNDYYNGFDNSLVLDNSVKYVTLMGSPLTYVAKDIARVVRKNDGVVIIYGKRLSDPDENKEIQLMDSKMSAVGFERKTDYSLDGGFKKIKISGNKFVYASKNQQTPIIHDEL